MPAFFRIQNLEYRNFSPEDSNKTLQQMLNLSKKEALQKLYHQLKTLTILKGTDFLQ